MQETRDSRWGKARRSWVVMLVLCAVFGAADARGEAHTNTTAGLIQAMEKLKPLHQKLGRPRPGDWLDRFRERGQTFAQYLAIHATGPTEKRKVIYIQPLGTFTAEQRKVVSLVADFMGRFFNLRVAVRKDIPLSAVPARARRTHPDWGVKQILTSYVLDEMLKPNLPEDAVVCIAFTTSDLWPGEGWNFVFGEASLRERVGVWSIYRNGDPAGGEKAFQLCLLRTLKTAVHETGHMFSMQHCIQYECGMCGSNHREESDRRPLWFCPECMAKVCRVTGADPGKRYVRLAEFCRAHGLAMEARFYERSARVLGENPETAETGGKPGKERP